MKITFITAVLSCMSLASQAQTTAMDFNRADCNGTVHHLFADLDAGKVVVLEYFMGPSCQSCMDAAQEIEGMKTNLNAAHPGKIMTYAMGFQNSYSCSLISNWVSSQSLTAIPMDSAATQVAYYGGFSMPTIVVVAGTSHSIIYTANPNNGGYTPGDTSTMNASIKGFLNPSGIGSVSSQTKFSVYPNPASDRVSVSVDVKNAGTIAVQILSLTGQVVFDAGYEEASAGTLTRTFSTAQLSAGCYVVRISVEGKTGFQKLTIMR